MRTIRELDIWCALFQYLTVLYLMSTYVEYLMRTCVYVVYLIPTHEHVVYLKLLYTTDYLHYPFPFLMLSIYLSIYLSFRARNTFIYLAPP